MPTGERPQIGRERKPREIVKYGAKPEGIQVVYDMHEGLSSFGPPEELIGIIDELYASGELVHAVKHYDSIDPTVEGENIRAYYGLGPDPAIITSTGGSDEILERLTRLFYLETVEGRSKKRTRKQLQQISTHIYGIGPQFVDMYNFVMQYRPEGQSMGPLMYSAFKPNLDTPLEDAIEGALDRRPNARRVVWYICDPGTPKGDSIGQYKSPEEVLAIKRRFAITANLLGDRIIFDEALGLFLPKEQSAVHLTDEFPNIFVLLSKKPLAVPGLRSGAMVMSKELGESYQRLRRNHDISAIPQLIANKLTTPDLLRRYIDGLDKDGNRVQDHIGDRTAAIKEPQIEELMLRDITVYRSDMRTSIFLAQGGLEGYDRRLLEEGILAVSAEGFRPTYPDTPPALPGNYLSSRMVRVEALPDKSQIPDFTNRMVAAIELKPTRGIPIPPRRRRALT